MNLWKKYGDERFVIVDAEISLCGAANKYKAETKESEEVACLFGRTDRPA